MPVAQEIYEAKSPKLHLVKKAISQLLQEISLLTPRLSKILAPGVTSSDDKSRKIQTASEASSNTEVLVGIFIGKHTAEEEKLACRFGA